MKHQARKRFGQHFLTDTNVLIQLMGSMRPKSEDNMVEIGPGLGAMTSWLVKYVAHLHVVEIDRDLAQKLREGQWKEKLTVHEIDVLKFDFGSLGESLRVAGNLPYNISSPILFGLLPFADRIKDQHFMLQKEVIDRMVAEPGSKVFGRLSVMLQAYYDMEHLFDVPPECFDPPPKVMSAIVKMVPRPADQRAEIPHEIFSQIVTAAFAQKRKMLRNNWQGLVSESLAASAGIALTSRAEQIPVANYLSLAKLIATAQ